jgi:hypothetical protein
VDADAMVCSSHAAPAGATFLITLHCLLALHAREKYLHCIALPAISVKAVQSVQKN